MVGWDNAWSSGDKLSILTSGECIADNTKHE